jgi:hypothetical protein
MRYGELLIRFIFRKAFYKYATAKIDTWWLARAMPAASVDSSCDRIVVPQNSGFLFIIMLDLGAV